MHVGASAAADRCAQFSTVRFAGAGLAATGDIDGEVTPLDDAGNQVRPLAREEGFWRVLDNGEIELLLTHPTGIVEMYAGEMSPAKVELRTDGVMRSPHAKEYAAAHRLYGYVNGELKVIDSQPVNGSWGDTDTNTFDTNAVVLPVSATLRAFCCSVSPSARS